MFDQVDVLIILLLFEISSLAYITDIMRVSNVLHRAIALAAKSKQVSEFGKSGYPFAGLTLTDDEMAAVKLDTVARRVQIGFLFNLFFLLLLLTTFALFRSSVDGPEAVIGSFFVALIGFFISLTMLMSTLFYLGVNGFYLKCNISNDRKRQIQMKIDSIIG
jgi:hypothetical protein